MKKKSIIIICLIALIIILIAGFVYYKYYYPYSGNAPAITEKELNCGAYYGFYDQKKLETPDNWVWNNAGKSSAWVAPNGSISCLWSD